MQRLGVPSPFAEGRPHCYCHSLINLRQWQVKYICIGWLCLLSKPSTYYVRVFIQSWLFGTFFLLINTAEHSFSRTATADKIANANHSISLCKQCSSHLAKTILPTPKCVCTLITRPPRSGICNSQRV